MEIGTARRIYGYDPIGNRETSITGAAGLTTTYNINNQVNQYSSTTNPSETFKYDADGNMTEDGTAEYTYDAENRLIKVVKSVAGNTEVQYTYDYMGRRVRSKSFYYGNPNGDIKYVFDGWLAVAELNGSISDQFVRAYTWGQDLSGSRDGAGGVGGLLSMTRADGVDYGYFYDANGNVTQVVRLTDGQVSANYRYDLFGNSIGQFDSINNPFRFSTKAFDYLTQLYYYGCRFYIPRLGRWINRDPIEERGGLLLYSKCGNNLINYLDPIGTQVFENPEWHHRFVQKHKKFFARYSFNVNNPEWGWILEKSEHQAITRKIQNLWDHAIFFEWQGAAVTPEMIESKLAEIEGEVKHLISYKENAPMKYWRWNKGGRAAFIAAGKVGGGVTRTIKVGGKAFSLITVWVAINAFQDATAAGKAPFDAISEASLEIVNVTPWSVREIIEMLEREYNTSSDGFITLQKSLDVQTRGNNLFDGWTGNDVEGSRSFMLKEYLSEGCE